MDKIYFENIQQTRLLHDEEAEELKHLCPCTICFNHQLVSSKSNLHSKENGRIYMGTAYSILHIFHPRSMVKKQTDLRQILVSDRV